MAGRRDNDPQFPEREGGSLLRASIAATPLTIGVTSALRGIHIDGSIKQPRESGIDQAMRQLNPRSARRGPPIPSIEDVNRFMNYDRDSSLYKRAWGWATQSVDPFTRKKMLNLTQNINNMSDAEVRSAISATVAGNESVAMSRIWNRFRRNVGLLDTQSTLPGFVTSANLPGFAQKSTIPMATNIPNALALGINRIQSTLGSTVSSRISGFTRPEVAAEGLGAWNVLFKGTAVGDIRFQLPQISGGVLLEGTELQTRRIAPDFVVLGENGKLQRISRTEMFMREFEQGIAPEVGGRLKTARDVERAIKQLKGKVFGELESSPNVLAESRTAAQAQREALRGMAVEMVTPLDIRKGSKEYRPGFRSLNADEISKTMLSTEGRRLGLKGGVGPKGLSQGMLSTVDWEKFSIGPVDYSRRPEQLFRQFQITEESMKALGQFKGADKYKALQMLGNNIAYENVARPHLKAVYVNPEIHKSFLERHAMGEGEALLRARTGDKLVFEESVTQKLIQAREDIAVGQFKAGDILGLTPEGSPFVLPEGTTVTGVRRSAGDELAVELLRKHQFAHGGKLFGGAKALALFREDSSFKEALSDLGVKNNADIIINMDELRKNKSLHRRQMIDALQDLIQRRGGPSTRAQARFISNPVGMAKQWAAKSTKGGVFSHRSFTERAMRFALRGMDVTPSEFGEIFGAVPHVMGEDKPGGVVSAMIQKALPRGASRTSFEAALGAGVAGGLPTFAYGGPMLDVGGLGSIEPRVFDILKSGPMGPLGENISQDLMQRLVATSPETLIAHQEIQKTLSSLTGQGSTLSGPVFRHGEDFQKFIERGGGVVRGGGVEMYVPGMDIMSQLRPYETASGVTTRTKVSDIYSDIAYQMGQVEEGMISQEQFRSSLANQADLLRKEFAPAGKGIGAVGRGKILGSRFLRGVSSQRVGGAASAIREANVVGITKANFMSMWEEMVESGLYQEQRSAMELMKTRFLSGQIVGGMIGRHPLLGEFSVQPIGMRMVEGRSDLIVLPEITKNIRIATEAGGEFTEKTLTFGPMVGLAGDKDADAYSAFLVSPNHEEAIRKSTMLQDSEFAQRYAQHQVRMQLFKAGKARAGSEIMTLGQMAADVEKLSVGQKWIAPLSLEISSAKRALTTFGSGQASADAKFLLEWLEQTPISAKHMTAEEAAGGGLQSLMMSITDAIQERNEKLLEGNVASIIKDDSVSKAMLQGSVFLDAESAKSISEVTGTKMAQQLQGIDLQSASKEMMRALNEADRTGFTRTGELLAGRGARAKQMEIAELAAKGFFKGAQEAPGMMKKVSSMYTAVNNKMGAVGAGLLRHHKAIGLGFAGTLALGAVLSEPPTTVGSGRATIPDARLNMNRRKAANRMKPEDMHPSTQDVGSPTPPQILQNQTTRISMSPPSNGARVRTRVPAGADTRAIASGFAGIGRHTSVNLRDNRSQLSPQEIASKLM